ncbi:MAG: hypothetical protein EBY30_05425 [Rhodospirillales bacterium]|nr:hypothetical protein [Rhodospirillales bacterium]
MAADPYGILGLKRDASAEAIKAAYRKLARKHHPDLNPGKPEAEARFKAVSAAHDLLSDPDKRGRFDRGEIDAEGQEQRPTASYRRHADAAQGARYDGQSGGSPFDDLFADMFEARRRAESAPRPGQDESYRLDVTFIDAMLGTTTPMRLPDGRSLSVRIPPGITSLVVSHDLEETFRIADQVIILAGGKIAAQGSPAEVMASEDPLVRQFVHAQADGPVRFHYPGPTVDQDFGPAVGPSRGGRR